MEPTEHTNYPKLIKFLLQHGISIVWFEMGEEKYHGWEWHDVNDKETMSDGTWKSLDECILDGLNYLHCMQE